MSKLLNLIQNRKGLIDGSYIFDNMNIDMPEEVEKLYSSENIVLKLITDDVMIFVCGDDSDPGTEVTFKINDKNNLEYVGHHKLQNEDEEEE